MGQWKKENKTSNKKPIKRLTIVNILRFPAESFI
jgi:hypothetical protein